jgi:hypothetical protein
MGNPGRRFPARDFRYDQSADCDCDQVGAGRGVAETDSALQAFNPMQRRYILKRRARLDLPAGTEDESAFALNVVVLYQDPLTLYWATELWDRVGELIGSGGICRMAWRISDLARPDLFAEAVRAAAKAHVMVVSFRDAGVLPPSLCEWVEAWMPRRILTGGALVALIGVPAQPNAPCGQAYAYVEAVARRAGLDFLPHERKLPDASASPAKLILTAERAIARQAG